MVHETILNALNLGEKFAVAFCASHCLRAETVRKAELRSGKTPDFRVYQGERLVFYCKAKYVQDDDWLDKQFEHAHRLELFGGLPPNPIYNQLAAHIHQAAKQFDAVNRDHE